MTDVYDVVESPNKENMTYLVSYMPNDTDVQENFNSNVEEI